MVEINIANFITVGLMAAIFWIVVRWIIRMVGVKV